MEQQKDSKIVEPLSDSEVLFRYDLIMADNAQTLRAGLATGFISGMFFGIILGAVAVAGGG